MLQGCRPVLYPFGHGDSCLNFNNDIYIERERERRGEEKDGQKSHKKETESKIM